MRYLLGFLVPACFGACLVACSAGSSSDLGSGGSGGSSSAGNGATSTGNGFGTGSGGSSGSGQACSDPACVGNTPQGGCDANLAIDSSNAMDGAKAMGLCQQYQAGTWGVKTASWVRADGSPLSTAEEKLGKGILKKFGSVIKPKEGTAMLALSSGTARDPQDPGYSSPSGFDKNTGIEGVPSPFPKDSPSCNPSPPKGNPHDSASLKLVIHTPKDAKSISYNLDFFSFEYPDYICSIYNDFFIALLTPRPPNLPDDNISFDAMGNNISVNAGFLSVCTPGNAGGKNFGCSGGYNEIVGTGFDDNTFTLSGIDPGSASTSWLETKAPVTPDTDITLQFAIWDGEDGVLDSTILIDNFKFELSDTVTGTTPIPK